MKMKINKKLSLLVWLFKASLQKRWQSAIVCIPIDSKYEEISPRRKSHLDAWIKN
jgi:hypothetical protein